MQLERIGERVLVYYCLFCEEWGAAIASPTLPHVRGEN